MQKKEQLEQSIQKKLEQLFGCSMEEATEKQMYKAVCTTVRDMLSEQRHTFSKDVLARGFKNFVMNIDKAERPLKDEYYLPKAVKEAMTEGATVKVLKTGAKWFGVTYREDREQVVSSIKELTDKGEYKKNLWR